MSIPIPYVLVGTAGYESLKPEIRRCYREAAPDPQGNTRFVLDLYIGENFEGMKDHTEFGPLVRALHRQQAEAVTLKKKIAHLESTRMPAGMNSAVLASVDIGELKKRNAAELAELERSTAAELVKADARIKSLEGALSATDKSDAITAALRRAGIKPGYERTVRVLINDNVVMVGDRVMARTEFGTMALDEFLHQWTESDDGAPYRDVAAPRHAHERVAPGTFSAMVKNIR